MPDSLSPRKRRHLRTRDAILDAARDIITKQGPDKLSMRALAREIDYSPAGLYEYFGSKEEIVEAVCWQGHERLTAEARRVDTSLPPDDYLVAFGMTYIQFALDNPDFYQLMFTKVDGDKNDGRTTSEQSSYLILMDCLQRGIEEGVFVPRPSFDAAAMAYAAWTAVHGIAMLRIAHLSNSETDMRALDEAVLRNLVRGLQVPV